MLWCSSLDQPPLGSLDAAFVNFFFIAFSPHCFCSPSQVSHQSPKYIYFLLVSCAFSPSPARVSLPLLVWCFVWLCRLFFSYRCISGRSGRVRGGTFNRWRLRRARRLGRGEKKTRENACKKIEREEKKSATRQAVCWRVLPAIDFRPRLFCRENVLLFRT